MRIRNGLCLALLLVLALSTVASSQSEKKVAYGVLIDNTGSLRTQFSFVNTLAKAVIARIDRRGSVSVFSFTTEGDAANGLAVVTPGVEWSEDKAVLTDYVDQLFVQPGRTALYDAIYAMAEKVNAKVDSEKDAFAGEVIILITDGEDRVSKIKDKKLIEKLKGSGITVYAIGLLQGLNPDGGFIIKSNKTKAESFLKRITTETGGRAVFPPSNKVDISTLLNELFAPSGSK